MLNEASGSNIVNFHHLLRFFRLSSLLLALLSIFTVGARLVGLTFHWYSIILMLFIVLFMATNVLIWWFKSRQGTDSHLYRTDGKGKSYWLPFGLAALSIAMAIIVWSINAPEEDDSFYISTVVHQIAQPHESLAVGPLHLAPWSDGSQVKTMMGELANIYENIAGAVAYSTGLSVQLLYQGLGGLFWGAMLVLVWALLFSLFIDRQALLYSLFCSFLVLIVVLANHAYGYGSFLSKLWIGKTILQYILLPLVAALAIDFLRNPEWRRGLALGSVAIASVAFSTSAMFLVPCLLFIVVLAAFLEDLPGFVPQKLIKYFWFVITLLPLATICLITLMTSRQLLQGGVVEAMGGDARNGLSLIYFNYFFGGPISLAVTLLVVGFGVSFVKRYKTRFIFFWTALAFLLFLNPLVDSFVARTISTELAYARMMNLVPWLLLIGLVFGAIFRSKVLGKRVLWHRLALFGAPILILIPTFFLNGTDYSFYIPGNAYWIGRPVYSVTQPIKIDPLLIADVKEIEDALPAGNTFTTIEYGLALPMLSGKYQTYFSNPYTGILSFANLSGKQLEGQMRADAVHFLLGDDQDKSAFLMTLSSGVQNVVVNAATDNSRSLKPLLEDMGFIRIGGSARYTMYTNEKKAIGMDSVQ